MLAYAGAWCTRRPVRAPQLSEGCQELNLMQHTVLGTNTVASVTGNCAPSSLGAERANQLERVFLG